MPKVTNSKVPKITKEVKGKFDPKKKVKTKRFVLKKFKLSANIGGYVKGAILSLECGKKTGIPKDSYWRRRLREAAIDNCMVLVVEPKVKAEVKVKDEENKVSNEGTN